MKTAILSVALVALAASQNLRANPSPASPAQDLASLTDDELLDLVKDKKNTTDRKVFEELGGRKTKSSFERLVSATDYVTSTWALRYGYQAFSSYLGVEALEEHAIDVLYDNAKKSDPKRSSAATYALSLFGEQCHEQLAKILKSSKDPATRSAALAPLLPSLASSGEKRALKTTCENLVLTYMVHRPLGVKTFKEFAETAGPTLLGKELANKRNSVSVRGMIITALEQTAGEESTSALVNGLSTKQPRLIYEALRSLARRGETVHLPELNKLKRHKDDSVRREALISEARILGGDPTYFERALDLSDHKSSVERCAAAIALSEIKTLESMEALHKLLADEDRSVRAEALLGVAAARQASSIIALIKRLDATSGTEHERTQTELRLLTGEALGGTARPWEAWWRDNQDTFEMPSVEESLKAEADRRARRASNETQASFYGLNITSERVSFVIDLSGSMNFKTKSGKTRLAALRQELDRFLADFKSGQLFNMIFFGNKATKWKPELCLMNDSIRSDAREHVRDLEAPGATAIYDGLLAAFEDQRVDTIYLLTDGGPSGGTIDDIDEIIAEVSRWNSLRHIVIHSVAVGRDSPLLKTLSSASKGKYIRVD